MNVKVCVHVCVCESVCVCVYVCVWERDWVCLSSLVFGLCSPFYCLYVVGGWWVGGVVCGFVMLWCGRETWVAVVVWSFVYAVLSTVCMCVCVCVCVCVFV